MWLHTRRFKSEMAFFLLFTALKCRPVYESRGSEKRVGPSLACIYFMFQRFVYLQFYDYLQETPDQYHLNIHLRISL